MKCRLFILALFAALAAQAQDVEAVDFLPDDDGGAIVIDNAPTFQSEIAVSYGYATFADLTDVFNRKLIPSYRVVRKARPDCTGAFGITFMRNTTRTLSFGCSLSLEHGSGSGTYSVSGAGTPHDGAELTYSDKHFFVNIMPTTRIAWRTWRCAALYSRISAGFVFDTHEQKFLVADEESGELVPEKKTKSTTGLAFQLSPLCIEVGSQRVRAFAELGFGTSGVANAGVRCAF